MRYYNPNRFNFADSTIAYLVILAVFAVFGAGFSFFLRSVLKEIYRYDTYAYLIINILFSQTLIFSVAAIWSGARKTSVFDGGGYKAKRDGVGILMGCLLIA
ncbi:MAG: hypothetical protein J5903_03980, partial [Clostridia bacterium]|nr:hypothetical protein [Clostridia bacterium]